MTTELLSEDEIEIVRLVREFVDEQVKPVVNALEHANTYPEDLIEAMKEMGIFGLAIPEPWGEVSVSLPAYCLVTEELDRVSHVANAQSARDLQRLDRAIQALGYAKSLMSSEEAARVEGFIDGLAGKVEVTL